jgi:hypothetical protein
MPPSRCFGLELDFGLASEKNRKCSRPISCGGTNISQIKPIRVCTITCKENGKKSFEIISASGFHGVRRSNQVT